MLVVVLRGAPLPPWYDGSRPGEPDHSATELGRSLSSLVTQWGEVLAMRPMKNGPGIASSRRAQARLGVAMSMPAVILSVAFILVPLVAAVYLAFTNWNGLTRELRAVHRLSKRT